MVDLTLDQHRLVSQLCARKASGEAIVLGIWAEGGKVDVSTIQKWLHGHGHAGFRHVDHGDEGFDADRCITVVEKIDRQAADEWIDLINRKRFRNQVILILDPKERFTVQFLNRILAINPPDGDLRNVQRDIDEADFVRVFSRINRALDGYKETRANILAARKAEEDKLK